MIHFVENDTSLIHTFILSDFIYCFLCYSQNIDCILIVDLSHIGFGSQEGPILKTRIIRLVHQVREILNDNLNDNLWK